MSIRRRLGVVLALSSLGAAVQVGPTSAAPPQVAIWVPAGPMAVERVHRGSTATLLPSGKVLVVGGMSATFELTGSAELYDPDTATWSSTGSMSVGRISASATPLPNGKVLVAGGWTCGPSFSNCRDAESAELYDPSTGTWSETGSMSVARDSHSATLLPNGKVLVAGGWINCTGSCFSHQTKSAELYDPATGTWSNTGSMSVARLGPATLLSNGKVLAVGGVTCSLWCDTLLTSAELYDPTTGIWANTGSMYFARGGHSVTALPNGQVLVAGGRADCYFCGRHTTTSSELYDPSTGTWSFTGYLAEARSSHRATLLPDGRVLVAGGGVCSDESGCSMLASAELYDPSTGTWSTTESMSARREGHTATLLQNGDVLVNGGNDPNPCSPLALPVLDDPPSCRIMVSAELYKTAGVAVG